MVKLKVSKFWLDDKAVVAAVKRSSIEPLIKCAVLVETEAKRSMRRGGRQVGPRGGLVQIPSPIGTPPHAQTGNLRSSITHAKTEDDTAVVGPTMAAQYGKYHEFGLRPFMRPAFHQVRSRFAEFFRGLKLKQNYRGRKA